MAVHDACGREMSGALRKYRAWTAQNSRNDANRTVVRTSFGSRSVPQSGSHNTDNFRGVCRAATAGLGKRTRETASKARVKELQRTPVGWRTLRWLIMRKQEELRSQAAEGEAMHREEMEQLHKERCRRGAFLYSSGALSTAVPRTVCCVCGSCSVGD